MHRVVLPVAGVSPRPPWLTENHLILPPEALTLALSRWEGEPERLIRLPSSAGKGVGGEGGQLLSVNQDLLEREWNLTYTHKNVVSPIMNPHLSGLKGHSPPSLPLVSNANRTHVLSGLQDKNFNAHGLFHASDGGAGLLLNPQKFSQVKPVRSTDRTNAFTYIQPSSFIQNRLAAAVKTSTIRFAFTANVPQPVRAVFRYAANIWQTLLASPVPIRIQVSWGSAPLSILGFAGPTLVRRDFRGAPMKKTWYPGALANKFAGKDLDRNLSDGVIGVNHQQPWYLGTDGQVPEGQFDLATIALHEIYHAISRSGSMDYAPRTGKGSWGLGTDFPGLYDRFTRNGSGQRLLNTKRFPNPSTALGRQLTGNNLFFNSPHSISANNGVPPRLFAPRQWSSGSSYIHLDEETYGPGNPNSLITPYFNLAEAIHNPGPITVGILKDMGWIPKSLPLSPSLPRRSRNWNEIEHAEVNRFTAIDFKTV